MQGCSCGYEGNCLGTECGTLRKWPKDPRARWVELIEWQNATAKRACLEKTPPSWLYDELGRLYDEAITIEDYIDVYSMMELAGMVYIQIGTRSHRTEWRTRDGQLLELGK